MRCRSAVHKDPLTDESFTDSVEDQLGDAVEAQFLEDVGAVGLDGGRADVEEVGDLFVGTAFGVDKLKVSRTASGNRLTVRTAFAHGVLVL